VQTKFSPALSCLINLPRGLLGNSLITMKKLILILCLSMFTHITLAQSLSYEQVKKLFNTWMNAKGKSTDGINSQLKLNNPKWKLQSPQPQVEGEERSYIWVLVNAHSDTTALVVYIEEDATTVKYSLRYAYRNSVLYNQMASSLKASPYYHSGRITSFKDDSKGQATITATPDETLPIAKRVDAILTDYNTNSSPKDSPLYTIDVFTRYIPKQQ
jgi:hypothetical protein